MTKHLRLQSVSEVYQLVSKLQEGDFEYVPEFNFLGTYSVFRIFRKQDETFLVRASLHSPNVYLLKLRASFLRYEKKYKVDIKKDMSLLFGNDLFYEWGREYNLEDKRMILKLLEDCDILDQKNKFVTEYKLHLP